MAAAQFDPAKAAVHLGTLSVPRGCGSAGKERARAYIKDELLSLGYRVEEQAFSFSTKAVYWLPKAYYLLLGACVLGAVLSLGPFPALSAALSASIIIFSLTTVVYRDWFSRLYRLSPAGVSPSEMTARNIIARREANGEPGIIFCAHYDTKSQTLPPLFAAFLHRAVFIAANAIALACIGLGLGLSARHVPPAGPLVAAAWAVCALSIPLILNSASDRSPGAFDNAGAVALLLELARCSDGTDIMLLLTDGEEAGLFGARRFVGEYGGRLAMRGTRIVNIDCIGAGPWLTIAGPAGNLAAAVKRCARDCGVPVRGQLMLTAMEFDHMPFCARSLPAVTLTQCGLNRQTLRIHSPRDTGEGIDIGWLGRTAEVCLKLVIACGR
jgi:hypothetical protein